MTIFAISARETKNMLQAKAKKDFRAQILLESWFRHELGNVSSGSPDLELLDSCRFLGIPGLISRPNGMVGAQWYRVVPFPSRTEDETAFAERKQIICYFSIPFFRNLDPKSLESALIFTLETIREIIVNSPKDFREAENKAFERIAPQLRRKTFSSKSTLNGANQTWAENMARLYFRLKSGAQIINIDMLSEFEDAEFAEAQRILRTKLSRVKSKIAGLVDSSFLRKTVLSPVPAVFRSIVPSSSFSLLGTMLAYNRLNQLSLVVIMVGTPLLEVDDLEVALAYHILSVYNERKYTRGIMEQEIFQLIRSKNDLNDQQIKRLYGEENLQKARNEIVELTNRLIEKNFFVIRLT
ncbi:MAG: hypothetical protein ACE5OZ_13280 [Candidatus Heimdallarchaeota archaeon]